MKRREVVKGLVAAPAVWSTGAWAQPTERVRRVGVLVSARAGDAEYLALLGAFRQRMAELGSERTGWTSSNALRNTPTASSKTKAPANAGEAIA